MKKLLIVAAAGALAACNSVESESTVTVPPPPTPVTSETSESSEETTEETSEEATDEATTAEANELEISLSVPNDWDAISETDGFAYHYMWQGNDWDDILAQRFSPPYPAFEPDAYIEILNKNLSGHEAGEAVVTFREDTTVDGYPGFVLDVQWQSADTFTSLTYLDVDGVIWELTANAQTQEGLATAESINSEATFQ